MRAPAPEAPPATVPILSRLGDPTGWLLSGPPAGAGPEPLAAHRRRWPAPPALRPGDGLDRLEDLGLSGRGGAAFPTARKFRAARAAGTGAGHPLLVANGSESEPASGKDAQLCRHRPQLVLDGAVSAAQVLGAPEVVLRVHDRRTGRVLAGALAERRAAGEADPRWRLSTGPGGYVAGEASAVVAALEGGPARPRFRTAPLARVGAFGRPTVVCNVETLALLGLLLRPAGAGAADARLVTLAGSVAEPGAVRELGGPVTLAHLLASAGWDGPPPAVLIGGYAGRWSRGADLWDTVLAPGTLGASGAHFGCGLVGVLGTGACGLAETARLTHYLAGQSAGQCGPCIRGLPALARGMGALARGRLGRRSLRRLERLARDLCGVGACALPDGAAALVLSALATFAEDRAGHLSGRPCPGAGRPGVLALPGGPR